MPKLSWKYLLFVIAALMVVGLAAGCVKSNGDSGNPAAPSAPPPESPKTDLVYMFINIERLTVGEARVYVYGLNPKTGLAEQPPADESIDRVRIFQTGADGVRRNYTVEYANGAWSIDGVNYTNRSTFPSIQVNGNKVNMEVYFLFKKTSADGQSSVPGVTIRHTLNYTVISPTAYKAEGGYIVGNMP